MRVEDISLAALILIFFRAVGFLALLPLGDRLGGSVRKIVLALMLAFVCIGNADQKVVVSGFGVVTEFLVGLVLCLPCALLINCSEMLGEMFDTGRGQTIGSIYDPLTGSSSSVMSRFARYYVWAVLLAAGGFEYLIGGFAASFQVLPVASLPFDALAAFGGRMMSLILQMLSGLLIVYLSWAILYLLVDTAAAFWARVMPQVPFFSEVFQLKSYLAFAALIILTNYGEIGGLLIRLAVPWPKLLVG